MPGARCTRGLVCKMHKESAHEHTGSAETLRHPPRNGFTAYAVLSSATNSPCHRHRRLEAAARPGWVRASHHRFGTSNGCQNHTVLPYATTRLRQPPSSEVGLRRVKRLNRALTSFVLHALKSLTRFNPPCDISGVPTLSRPPHPAPRS